MLQLPSNYRLTETGQRAQCALWSSYFIYTLFSHSHKSWSSGVLRRLVGFVDGTLSASSVVTTVCMWHIKVFRP